MFPQSTTGTNGNPSGGGCVVGDDHAGAAKVRSGGQEQHFSEEVLERCKTAKLYIEHLYKSQSQSFKERLDRRHKLEHFLDEQRGDLSAEERRAYIEEHLERESQFTRLQRQRLSILIKPQIQLM